MKPENLFVMAARCLYENGIERKLQLTRETHELLAAGQLDIADVPGFDLKNEPGRPEKPVLVAPASLPRRKFSSPEGKAAMLHAIAHIEFNAINLAWDAVCRFRNMPHEYYLDWSRIAAEEACHFSLVRERLKSLACDYGDYSAHNGLWELALKTAHDPMVRMAMIPRVMEARGLDVTPGIRQKFIQAGDQESAAVLDIILRDEVGHVASGDVWFRYLCDKRGLDAEKVFSQLLAEYMPAGLRGPFNLEARSRAGFSREELDRLAAG